MNQSWDGVAKGDKCYVRIYATIMRIAKSIKDGSVDAIIANEEEDGSTRSNLKSKSVIAGARGRKVVQKRKVLEKKLLKWCTKQWDNGKKVTRGIMFRRAMLIDPSFCGGNFIQLKKWFYGGFKKRSGMSKRVVSSCGQKLPKDWEEKQVSIVNRVSHSQMPTQRQDGSFLPGVKDQHMGNTDQVPFYVEMHSNHQWGFKSHRGRRMVGTAGKEKDRFTVQLTIFKNGRKIIDSVETIFVWYHMYTYQYLETVYPITFTFHRESQ